MKKTITIALLLFVMLLSSCDNAGEPVETSGTTGVTTAEITAEATTDAETGANTEVTTEHTDSENKLNPDEEYLNSILSEYEIIETNQEDFNGISNLENVPSGKYAIKFTDIPGAAFAVSPETEIIYAFGRELHCEEHFSIEDFSGYVNEDGEGVLVLTGTSGVNKPRSGWQYVITETHNYLLEMNGDRYNTVITANPETKELEYYRYNKDFFAANNQGLILWLDAYKTEDEIFEQSGAFTAESGKIEFIPKESVTLNQWYKSDDFAFPYVGYSDCKEKRDLWGFDTFIEFICNYGVEKHGWTSDDLGEYESFVVK